MGKKSKAKQEKLRAETRKTYMAVGKWIAAAILAQLFWQMFWHYWGEHMLAGLPIILVRSIFVAMSYGWGFFFAWKISGMLLKHKPAAGKRSLQYMFSFIALFIIASTSPIYASQISERPSPVNETQTLPQPPIGDTSHGTTGIKIDDSKDISFSNGRISGFDTGVATSQSENITFSNTEITGQQTRK